MTLLDELAGNDAFCAVSHSKYAHRIMSFAECPNAAVKENGCCMIQHFANLGRELKGNVHKDLRVRVFNLSTRTSLSALPQDTTMNTSFTSSSSGGMYSPSNAVSEPSSFLVSNDSFISNEGASSLSCSYSNANSRDVLPSISRDVLPSISRDVLPSITRDTIRTTLVSSEVAAKGVKQREPYDDSNEGLSDASESSSSVVEMSTPYHNGNASVLEIARRSTRSSNADLRFVDSEPGESGDESEGWGGQVLGGEEAIARRLRRMERVFYVMMHLYQTSSYLIVIQQRYAALYQQFLEELEELRGCLTAVSTHDGLSEANEMVDDFLSVEPYILSSFFKLLLLCCRNYYTIPDRMAEFQRVYPQWQQEILDLKEGYLSVRKIPCEGQEERLAQIAEEAMKLQERLQSAAVENACLEYERPELLGFIQKLVEMVSVLLSSSYVHDLSSRIDLYTLFYIASIFFLSIEHDQTYVNIDKPIYDFLWQYGSLGASPVECSPAWTPWWPTFVSSTSSACTESPTARSPGAKGAATSWPTSFAVSTRTSFRTRSPTARLS